MTLQQIFTLATNTIQWLLFFLNFRCISSFWCKFDDRWRERKIPSRNPNICQRFRKTQSWSKGNWPTHQRIWGTIGTYPRKYERSNQLKPFKSHQCKIRLKIILYLYNSALIWYKCIYKLYLLSYNKQY